MHSKCLIDLDYNNNPVIKLQISSDTSDVRDKIANRLVNQEITRGVFSIRSLGLNGGQSTSPSSHPHVPSFEEFELRPMTENEVYDLYNKLTKEIKDNQFTHAAILNAKFRGKNYTSIDGAGINECKSGKASATGKDKDSSYDPHNIELTPEEKIKLFKFEVPMCACEVISEDEIRLIDKLEPITYSKEAIDNLLECISRVLYYNNLNGNRVIKKTKMDDVQSKFDEAASIIHAIFKDIE